MYQLFIGMIVGFYGGMIVGTRYNCKPHLANIELTLQKMKQSVTEHYYSNVGKDEEKEEEKDEEKEEEKEDSDEENTEELKKDQ